MISESEGESSGDDCDGNSVRPFTAQVVSDLHLEINGVFENLIPVKGDLLILPGDISTANLPGLPIFIQWASKSFCDVIYVCGNHEYYRSESISDAVEKIKKLTDQHDNVHFLERSSVVINGIRFLGTTFWSRPPTELSKEYIQGSFNDYNHIRVKYEHSHFGTRTRLLRVSDTVSMHDENVKWLDEMFQQCREKNEKCCVVTHHVPLLGTKFLLPQERFIIDKSRLNEEEDERRNLIYGNCTDESELIIRNMDVLEAWFYGHTHLSLISTFGKSDLYPNSKNEDNNNSDEDDEIGRESDHEKDEKRIWMISNQVGYSNGWSVKMKDSKYNPDLLIKFPLEKAIKDVNKRKVKKKDQNQDQDDDDDDEVEVWGENSRIRNEKKMKKKKKKSERRKRKGSFEGVLRILKLKK